MLAVCGWSGSGKTSLLEQLIPQLVRCGLRVAVVKSDVHGLAVDRPGKDSDRLFQAGADVVVAGPGEELWRRHRPSEQLGHLRQMLERQGGDHDLILVEGHKQTPLPKVWLASAGDPSPPPEVEQVLEVLPWDGPRTERLLALVDGWLAERWQDRRRLAVVLVGGASRRMGRPKQLLEWQGRPLLERVVGALEPQVEQVVIAGTGPLPESCGQLPRLADVPGLRGPLAGLLACLRWAPAATWFAAACDLPLLTTDAVTWLDGQRAAGRWAVLPQLDDAGVEPLLAVYEPQSRRLLEQLAGDGHLAPRDIASHPAVFTPCPPAQLQPAWSGINSPEDLDRCARVRRETGV